MFTAGKTAGRDRSVRRTGAHAALLAVLMMSASVLLSLGLGELAIRALYGSPLPFRAPQPRYVAGAYGYKLEPEQRSFIGDKPLVANAHGFRDDPWVVPKPPGRRRILIVGDSMPFGYHVHLEDTFGKVLERELHRSTPDVEVRVAAISGWDTWMELQFLEAEGMRLEPDLVVLSLFINDFRTVIPSRPSAAPGLRVNTRPRWSRWLPEETTLSLKRSALVLFVRSRFEWVIASIYDRFIAAGESESGVETRLMANAEDAGTRAAMEAMQSLLEAMNGVVRERGAEFTIVFMPNYELFGRGPDSVDFVRTLRRFARARGIAFINPTEDFRRYGNVDDLYLRPWDNAHFSALGHRLVAERLFEELEPRIVRDHALVSRETP